MTFTALLPQRVLTKRPRRANRPENPRAEENKDLTFP
jgi:hypothetical protein